MNGNLGTQGLLNKTKPWSVPLERRCPLCHEGWEKKLSEASTGNRKTRLRTPRPDALPQGTELHDELSKSVQVTSVGKTADQFM